MNLPPEIEEGGVEYKLQLTPLFLLQRKRAESLATQMRWRVRESPFGYATYFIGVNDDGFARGLLSEKLECSLTTLSAVAELAGAEIVSIIRRPARIPSNYFAEVLVVLVNHTPDADKAALEMESTESYCDLGYFSSVVDLFADLNDMDSNDSNQYGKLDTSHEAMITTPTLPERDTLRTIVDAESPTQRRIQYAREIIASFDPDVSRKDGCLCDGQSLGSVVHGRGLAAPVTYNSMGVPKKCVCQRPITASSADANLRSPKTLSSTVASTTGRIDTLTAPQTAEITTPSIPSPFNSSSTIDSDYSSDDMDSPLRDLPNYTDKSTQADTMDDPIPEASPLQTLHHTSPKLEPTASDGVPDDDKNSDQVELPQKHGCATSRESPTGCPDSNTATEQANLHTQSAVGNCKMSQSFEMLSVDDSGTLRHEYQEFWMEMKGVWNTVGSHWSVKGRNMSEIWQEMRELHIKLLEISENRELTLEELQILRQIKAFEKQRKYERKVLARQLTESSTQHQSSVTTDSIEGSFGEVQNASTQKLSRRRRRNANAVKQKMQAACKSMGPSSVR